MIGVRCSWIICWVVSLLCALPTALLAQIRVDTLDYGGELGPYLDLYRPETTEAASLPLIVLAHGGLWQVGSRESLETLCRNLVQRSGERFACASIDYPASQDLGGTCTGTGRAAYRDQAVEFARAYTFLQENAEALGLDPGRMFIGGHSAGGHLAQILNLRWDEFAGPCTRPGGCPAPLGAIGIEGIYDIPNWNRYDEERWGGRFACATRKAFGAPGPEPPACMEDGLGARCWDAGSPQYLAERPELLPTAPAGSVLLVQSPGDDWVDGGETVRLGQALSDAWPELLVIADAGGACGMSGHDAVLQETVLADCIADFIDAAIDSAPAPFRINAGLSDAWFDPRTNGQGFFINVWESIGILFVGWFTYDAERPRADATAVLGEPGHRWFTAQGPFDGNVAELDLYLTSGGVFDMAEPPVSPAERVGRLQIRFSGCNAGVISYELTDAGRRGEIPVQRIVADNIPLCEALGEVATQ